MKEEKKVEKMEQDPKLFEEAKEEFENIKTVLMIKSPFWASILKRCRIVASPTLKAIAAIDEKGVIRLNLKLLGKCNIKGKMFVFCHEPGHIAFHHFVRGKGKSNRLWNVAADCPINTLLQIHGFLDGVELPYDIVTSENLAPKISRKPEEVAKMSAEELYPFLEKHRKSMINFNIMDDIFEGGSGDEAGEGDEGDVQEGESKENSKEGKNKDGAQKDEEKNDKEKKGKNKKGVKEDKDSKDESKEGDGGDPVIQEGDPEAYKPGKTEDEVRDYWRKAVAQATVQARMAGKLPADAERIIRELLRAKVDWKKVIKKELLNGIGKTFISTWQKISRKHPLFPGVKQMTHPNIRILPDASGSINEREWAQFLSEALSICKNYGKVIITPWDVKPYPSIELKNPQDAARKIKGLKQIGGGGTVIAPALEETLKSIKFGDIVVIVTDGEIYDIGEKKTQQLLYKIGIKCSVAVFASVASIPGIPLRWKKVKIEL